jgi:hypothetical protein
MTTAAVRSEHDERVRELYARYKSLALAVGAALVLDAPRDELSAEALELLEDARAALLVDSSRRVQLEACVGAAEKLRDLLESDGFDVEAVRATHKRLRREVWKIVPCEYVPCCASTPHAHERTGENHG